MGRITAVGIGAGLIVSTAMAQTPTQVFPFITIDVATRVVEIEGVVPVDCHDEETPEVFLEVVACTPGTKEHEALVMTRAKPSQIHAALLSIGLEPGKPGRWSYDGETLTRHAPEGPEVKVEIVYANDAGEVVETDVREWIVEADSGKRFQASWVFAGSRMVTIREQAFYDADGTGLVVGLTTFGSEVVACDDVISHEADVTEPTWIANRDMVPAYKTPVRLRLSVVEQDVETPESPPDD